jgi:hypothetical protein
MYKYGQRWFNILKDQVTFTIDTHIALVLCDKFNLNLHNSFYSHRFPKGTLNSFSVMVTRNSPLPRHPVHRALVVAH